jgi:RHS repeat-associated protein
MVYKSSPNAKFGAWGRPLSAMPDAGLPDAADAGSDHVNRNEKCTSPYYANGNPVTRIGRKGNWALTWNALNQLTQIVITGRGQRKTIRFTYDPFGRRIGKEVVAGFGRGKTTTTTAYVYDGQDIVLQRVTVKRGHHETTTETRFIHGPGTDEPLAMVRNNRSYFYQADGLGSIVEITDSDRRVVQKYRYNAFGVPSVVPPGFSHRLESRSFAHRQPVSDGFGRSRCSSPVFGFMQPYGFTGREWYPETGLYFYRARYYDHQAGRFISRDPIGFAGGDLSLYGYCLNNPVNFNDPMGLCTDHAWYDPRKYFSVSTTTIFKFEGMQRSMDGKYHQPVSAPTTLYGGSLDINFGSQPDPYRDSISEIGLTGVGRGGLLSLGRYDISNENGDSDERGGIAIHMGFRFGLPVGYLSFTHPDPNRPFRLPSGTLYWSAAP